MVLIHLDKANTAVMSSHFLLTKGSLNFFNKKSGFSLVELMIVIAITGILAAMATPSYKTYVTKSRVLNAMIVLDSLKTEAINNYAKSGGSFAPEIAGTGIRETGVGMNAGIITTTYFYNMNAPHISIFYCKPANYIGSVTVQLTHDGIANSGNTAYLGLHASHDHGIINWQCITASGGIGIKDEFLPSGCVTVANAKC